jgi:glycosyltransferase involved in cell wall biosynthesis
MSVPTAAIFSCTLLPPSETFIRAQGEALRRYRAHYVGCRHVPGLALPAERSTTVNPRDGGAMGKAGEALFKYTGRAGALERRLRALQPRLMHAHFGTGGALALPLARRLGVPLIVTYHGADATKSDQAWRNGSHTHRIYLRRRTRLFREARRFIAVSDFIRRKLLAQGVADDRIIVHYIGIDTEYFAPTSSAEQRHGTVLFVGRLTEKKGCADLIRAMARVQANHASIELKVIGDGPLRESLETSARQSLKRCAFLGQQPHEVIRREMAAARVFCVPSVTAADGDAEGFGLVFAEAQAMGTPVVSTTSGGIPEAVAHGRTGFLASERDIDGLARGLIDLIENCDLWRAFSAAGRKFVCHRFDLKKQTRLLEAHYDAAAGVAAAPDGASIDAAGDAPADDVSVEYAAG